MHGFQRPLLRLASVMLAALACSGDDGPTDPPAEHLRLTGVRLSVEGVLVPTGDVQIVATVLGADAAQASLEWTSETPDIASVDSDGRVTGVTVGTARIRADVLGTLVSSAIDIAVVPDTPRSIQLSPESATAFLGDTVRFRATVRGLGAAPLSTPVRYESANAELAIVDPETGLATPVRPGSVTIMAMVADLVASGTLNGENRSPIVRITAPATDGEVTWKLLLQGAAEDPDGHPIADSSYVWSSDAQGPLGRGADVDVVLQPGPHRLRLDVTDRFGGLGTATRRVTVATPPDGPVRIALVPDSVEFDRIRASDTLQVRGWDAYDRPVPVTDVTWVSGSESVAWVEAGVVTSAGAGSTWAEASTGGLSARARIVVAQRPGRVTVNAPDTLVFVGSTLPLQGGVLDPNWHPIQGLRLSWTSDDPAVASVDEAGVVTGRLPGRTRIRGSYGDLSSYVAVRVVPAADAPVSLTLTFPKYTLYPGERVQSTVTAYTADERPIPVSVEDVTSWRVSVVERAHMGFDGVLTALGVGPVRVGVEALGLSAQTDIEIVPVPHTLTITNPWPTYLVGSYATLGAATSGSASLSWTSRDSAVASVTESGRVDARSAGTTWVVGTFGLATDSVRIVVNGLDEAFIAGNGGGLLLLDTLGSAPSVVLAPLNGISWLEWSPDGTRLAVAENPSNEVWIVAADGTNPMQVLGPSPERVYSLEWSPDGTHLAVSRRQTRARAYIVDAATGTATPIHEDLSAMEVTWSPDGQRIAFSGWDLAAPGGTGIYVSRPDGSDRHQITRDSVSTAGRRHLRWSPSADLIAYTHHLRFPGLTDGRLIRSDGSHVAWLSQTPDHHEYAFVWSPDGTRVVFHQRPEHQSLLDAVVYDTATGATVTIPRFHGSWSADGAWLLDGWRLVPADGSAEPRRLNLTISTPTRWRPGG